ncbi:MAG: TIGR03663 family protein [Chloroflexi bacterium]|nr:TIGR03663 family protein [Chloroflexota bacterium]
MSTPENGRVNADRRRRARLARRNVPAVAAPVQSAALRTSSTLRGVLTAEMAAFGAIFVVGLAIRLAHLGGAPLDPGEATRALGAWQLIRGEIPPVSPEPLVTLAAALSFFGLGDNDAIARLAPTAIGSAMVLLPWLLRDRLGRLGAVMASLFLAVSPTFVSYSRTLSGDIFAAALSLGLLICLLRYVDEKKPRWAVAGAGLVALFLNSGAPGLSTLLVLAVFFALLAALGKKSNEYAQAWRGFREDRETAKLTAIVLIGGFVLVATGFLGDLFGLRLPALSAWIAQFNLVPDGRPWYYHLQLLFGIEPLVTMFGLAAAVYYVRLWLKPSSRRSPGLAGLLVFWSLAGVLVGAFAADKYGGQLIASVLPLTLLAGALVGELRWGDARLTCAATGERQTGVGDWLLLGAAPLLVYAFLAFDDLTRKGQVAMWYQWTLALLALTIAATLVLASLVYGGKRVSRRAVLVGLVLLLGYSVHSTWRTAFAGTEDRGLAGLPGRTTSRSLVDAVSEVDDVATAKFLGKSISIAVEPGLRLPIQWYLRNYLSVEYTAKPKPGTQAIFWPVEPPPDVKLEDYYARKAALGSIWNGDAGNLRGLWRWLMFGDAPETRQAEPMMLYLQK